MLIIGITWDVTRFDWYGNTINNLRQLTAEDSLAIPNGRGGYLEFLRLPRDRHLFLNVKLIITEDTHIIIRIRKHDLYFVGFRTSKDAKGKWWSFQGADLELTGANVEILNFSGGYDNLGILESCIVSGENLESAIYDLVRGVKDGAEKRRSGAEERQKNNLMLLIVMFPETMRFRYPIDIKRSTLRSHFTRLEFHFFRNWDKICQSINLYLDGDSTSYEPYKVPEHSDLLDTGDGFDVHFTSMADVQKWLVMIKY